MFDQLKEIAFHGNKINSCDWLKQSNIPKLQVFDISKNEILQIPELNIETLTVLNISYNKINSLAFFKTEKLKKLKEFDASHNEITDVPVMNLPLATKINLTSNRINRFVSVRIEGEGEEVNFIDSQLPVLTWLGIVKDNKFEARAIVMMEMERIFEYVKHIE
jgi:Leucine-rich repeat (LRR) protein